MADSAQALLGQNEAVARVQNWARRRLFRHRVFHRVDVRHILRTLVDKVHLQRIEFLLDHRFGIVLQHFLLVAVDSHSVVHRRRCWRHETLVVRTDPLSQNRLRERLQVAFVTLLAAEQVLIQRRLLVIRRRKVVVEERCTAACFDSEAMFLVTSLDWRLLHVNRAILPEPRVRAHLSDCTR